MEKITNSTLETIHQRHSVRQFQEREVDDATIKAILEAANQAPSAHNQQSWEFTIIRGEKKMELSQLVNDRIPDFPKRSAALLRLASRSLANAPVAIAVKNTGALIEGGPELFQIEREKVFDFFRTMEIQSSAAAVENLLLAATSLGLGSVWLGVLYLIKNDILTFLGEKEGEFMAIIPMGYPKKSSSGPKKKELEYVIKYLE